MSQKDNIKKLMVEHHRHLQKLKEQQASLGLHTPTHILTEIEDRTAEIAKLQTALETLEENDADEEALPGYAPEKSQRAKSEWQRGGVSITGGSVTVGGDIVGGDKVTHGNSITMDAVGADTAAQVGRGDSSRVTNSATGLSDLAAALAQWQAEMEAEIDTQSNLSADDKQDLKELTSKIKTEAAKEDQVDANRLEKLVNTLAVMAPDIFEMAVASLVAPCSNIGLELKKFGNKVKLERTGTAS